MYTLRKIDKDQRENNTSLGNSHSVIREINPEFNDILNNLEHPNPDNIHLFVFDENGKLHVVHKSEQAYIMADNGKTFSNLTYK